jgi:hypothetical protein
VKSTKVSPIPGLAENVELNEGDHIRIWISARVRRKRSTGEPEHSLEVLDWGRSCRRCENDV